MTEISLWEVVVIQSVSHVRLFVTPWLATHQAPLSSAISRSLLKFMSIEEVMLSNHLTLCHPFLFLPSIFPSIGAFYNEFLFASGGQKIGASASTSVLPVNIKGWFPLGLTVLSPCHPEDSQGSSPAPQFKSISSSVVSFLYSPTLTSIHDYWKNHTFD